MAKPNTNPSGRVSVDLLSNKARLDRVAEREKTTSTNLARLIILHGLESLEKGEIRLNHPTLAAVPQ